MESYPPPPWQLKGHCLLRLQMLPIERVRDVVPTQLEILPVAPGRTLGGVYIVQYEAGSSLEYHELIVVPAMVRRGIHVGAWVSHIYVDNPSSREAGREIWGLPKELAQFSWKRTAASTEVAITRDATPLCTISAVPRTSGMRLPLYAPMLAQRGDALISYRCKGSGRMRTSTCELDIPAESPFAPLGITGGRHFQIDAFNFALPAPERIDSF